VLGCVVCVGCSMWYVWVVHLSQSEMGVVSVVGGGCGMWYVWELYLSKRGCV